jgi:hypothetical protein
VLSLSHCQPAPACQLFYPHPIRAEHIAGMQIDLTGAQGHDSSGRPRRVRSRRRSCAQVASLSASTMAELGLARARGHGLAATEAKIASREARLGSRPQLMAARVQARPAGRHAARPWGAAGDHCAGRVGEGGAGPSRTEARWMSRSLAMARADGAPVARAAGRTVSGQCLQPEVIASVPRRRGGSGARGWRRGEGAALREKE